MPPQAAELQTAQIVVAYVLMLGILGSTATALVRAFQKRPLLPEPKPRTVPWGLKTMVLAAIAYVYLGLIVSLVFHRAMGPGSEGNLTLRQQMTAQTIVNALAVLLVPLLVRRTSGASWDDLGFTRRDLFLNIRLGFWMCLVTVPWVYLVNVLALRVFKVTPHPLTEMIRHDGSWSTALLAVVSAVILAPAAEEFLFRGIILGGLTWKKRRVQPKEDSDLADPAIDTPPSAPSNGFLTWPNLVTSALFASLHYSAWPAPLAIFALSLSLGNLYVRTGSLAAPIAMHALFNGITTTMLLIGPPEVAPTPETPVRVESVVNDRDAAKVPDAAPPANVEADPPSEGTTP